MDLSEAILSVLATILEGLKPRGKTLLADFLQVHNIHHDQAVWLVEAERIHP